MEYTIIEEKENKLLSRKEVKFEVDYEGEATPNIIAVKSKLVALLGTKKDLIVVDNLQPKYGEPVAEGYAKIYNNKEALNDIETPSVLEKNKEPEPEPEEETEEEATEETAEETEEAEE